MKKLKGSRWSRFWESKYNDEDPDTVAWERRESEMLSDALLKTGALMFIGIMIVGGLGYAVYRQTTDDAVAASESK